VYDFAKLYIDLDADAKDIVQDVFVKLWEMRDRIDEAQDLDNLLFIITRNHIFRLGRLKVNQSHLCVTALQALDVEDSHDATQDIDLSELKRHIDTIVNHLPARRREVFLMSRVQKLSHAEIALRLSVSVRAVERHVYLALDDIKKGLKKIYGNDSGTRLFLLACF
jgi:RNA polymerase sigma-70 factor (ECF subfamily)